MPRMPSLLASAADFVSIVISLLLPVPSLMHQDIRVEPMEKILPSKIGKKPLVVFSQVSTPYQK